MVTGGDGVVYLYSYTEAGDWIITQTLPSLFNLSYALLPDTASIESAILTLQLHRHTTHLPDINYSDLTLSVQSDGADLFSPTLLDEAVESSVGEYETLIPVPFDITPALSTVLASTVHSYSVNLTNSAPPPSAATDAARGAAQVSVSLALRVSISLQEI